MSRPVSTASQCGFSRRKFLASCAGLAAGAGVLSHFGGFSPVLLAQSGSRTREKTRVRLVFAHPDPDKPNWPNIGYDFAGYIQDAQAKFAAQCPEIEFLPLDRKSVV